MGRGRDSGGAGAAENPVLSGFLVMLRQSSMGMLWAVGQGVFSISQHKEPKMALVPGAPGSAFTPPGSFPSSERAALPVCTLLMFLINARSLSIPPESLSLISHWQELFQHPFLKKMGKGNETTILPWRNPSPTREGDCP